MSDLYAVAGTSFLVSSFRLSPLPDFCLIPIGTGSTSVAEEVAECQRVLAQTGLKYKMHGYGTNIEGPWSKVSQAIHDCHAAVHAKGAQRVATDIRIGTRIDREIPYGEGNDAKVARVEAILSQDKTSTQQ
ncbi:hypothetical protein CVT26_015117 [Gymnopilus dilepis]|uniref:Thiamine-binding protein domain-containing protein n=1 Tax=Gymnopilus dilepis TaxID=231916 RepID=A0A409YET7_9AGAR|nr:hypothetical protein CVT26_015117 [Gymnopilus dilepis]